MRLYPRSLQWRTIWLTMSAVAVVLVNVCIFHGADICREVSRHYGNFQLRNDEDPVIRALARGEIHPGSDIEEIINKYPPKSITHRGEFVQLEYAAPPMFQSGPSILAMDGRAVFARQSEYRFYSHLPSHDFFDARTRQERNRCFALWGRPRP